MDDRETQRAERDEAMLRELHTSPPMPFHTLIEKTGRGEQPEEERGFGDRISQMVGRSERATPPPPRALRLEAEGAIVGYRAVIDPRRLDMGQVGFVHVALRDLSPAALDTFAKAVLDVPQIEACHMIAGDFHYLLRVRTDTVKDFRDLLTSQIAQFPAVVRTNATLAMETVKES